jgi:hypothetical protein
MTTEEILDRIKLLNNERDYASDCISKCQRLKTSPIKEIEKLTFIVEGEYIHLNVPKDLLILFSENLLKEGHGNRN